MSHGRGALGLSMSQVFLLNMLVPALVLGGTLLVYGLPETRCVSVLSLRTQLAVLWEMVQRSAVHRPCAFIFVYSELALTFYYPACLSS